MTDESPHLFWSLSAENGKVSPEILDLYIFLQQRGFRKRTIADEIEVYRQNGHFVNQCFTSDQINEVIHFLKNEHKSNSKITIAYDRKGIIDYEYTPKEILEKLVKYGWGKIFNDNNCNHLPELAVSIKKHTHNSAFFYFRNGFVQVTKDDVNFHSYKEIEGQYIYKDYLVDRDISILDIDSPINKDFAPRGHQFFDFLNRIAGIPEDAALASMDQINKLKYLMECIGFLLHDYKQQGLTDYALILCDDQIGGSGKGIIIQAIRQMTKVAEVDAKKEDRFDPEELTERTRVKVYNDIEANFNFRLIYNEITDQAVIRPMYKSPRYVPYKEAWKVLFTSNHIVRGNSGADNRRQRVFSLSPFFNEHNTPRDHYNHSFFSEDWKENDWNYFYSLMFQCVKFWLNADYKLSFNDPEYVERKIEEEYPYEFREYMEELLDGVRKEGTLSTKTAELYYKFKEIDRYKLSPFVRKLEIKFFGRLLRKYLDGVADIAYHRPANRIEISIWKK